MISILAINSDHEFCQLDFIRANSRIILRSFGKEKNKEEMGWEIQPIVKWEEKILHVFSASCKIPTSSSESDEFVRQWTFFAPIA